MVEPLLRRQYSRRKTEDPRRSGVPSHSRHTVPTHEGPFVGISNSVVATALASLTPSEQAVTHSFLLGLRYSEIAVERGRSIRTIANQIASAFRKLGVSGRSELVHKLTSLQAQTESPLPSTQLTSDMDQADDAGDAIWFAATEMWKSAGQAAVDANRNASELLAALRGR